ncbi:YafY family protein [Schumannella sp. 10F1B-5-1]|uniref:helix-turn-helix transcriptional regulator n=1 Tax=Schumannella sp. 10F1B-5-1 TaxID=2590780 RepID=UPI0011304C0F|nr:WYL domain-containing protein [Schumannella sp. 10F1B-5-1]TPW78292.1 WYL domain-containing protein [Schumannella sp. 10F1B-5-1]
MSTPSSRMLALLSLLQVHRDWAGEVLAERLDVSPRTVRRDVDRLRELGYRIVAAKGPSGGYRLEAGSDLPPLLFDDEQAVAIALALAVAPASGADIAEASTRALAAVRQVMPSRLRHRVDAVRVATADSSGAGAGSGRAAATLVDPEVLVAASEAARNHEVLRFDYDPAWGEAVDRPARRVEPHAVIARGGRWYLLAWNDEADDWSTFRLDRMHPRPPTRLRFAPRPIPGGDAVAFVEARFKGASSASGAVGGAAGGWPCVGTADVAAPARRLAPFLDPGAEIEELDAETSRITLGSWSWGALAARFAGFDAGFRIQGPDALRDAARELGDRASVAASDRAHGFDAATQ